MCDQPEPNLRLILVHLNGVIDNNSFSLWSPNTNRILLCPDTLSLTDTWQNDEEAEVQHLCPGDLGGASPTPCMSHSCSRFVLLPWTQTLREAGCLPFSGTAPWEAPPGTGRPSPLGRGSQMHHLPMFSPFPSWSLPLPLPSSLSEMMLDKYHSFQYRQCKTTPIKSTESNTWTCTVST